MYQVNFCIYFVCVCMRSHWPLKLDSHGGDVPVQDGPVRLDLPPGLQLLLGLPAELLQAQRLAATQGHAVWHRDQFLTSGFLPVTRRPATWSLRGSAPPAPACPAETPPYPAASDTGSTWRWERGSRTGWPAARRSGRESGDVSKK